MLGVREEVLNSSSEKVVACIKNVLICSVWIAEIVKIGFDEVFKVCCAGLHNIKVNRTGLHAEYLICERAVTKLTEEDALLAARCGIITVVLVYISPVILRIVYYISVVVECSLNLIIELGRS